MANSEPKPLTRFERLGIRLVKWLDREGALREAAFERRVAEDPVRELKVQTVRKMILQHKKAEDAALAIVDYFLPKR